MRIERATDASAAAVMAALDTNKNNRLDEVGRPFVNKQTLASAIQRSDNQMPGIATEQLNDEMRRLKDDVAAQRTARKVALVGLGLTAVAIVLAILSGGTLLALLALALGVSTATAGAVWNMRTQDAADDRGALVKDVDGLLADAKRRGHDIIVPPDQIEVAKPQPALTQDQMTARIAELLHVPLAQKGKPGAK